MKIQHKRSLVLESGKAKQPDPSQMEYGELAVNYNGSDPAIFIKDNTNQIIRIAGSGSEAGGMPDGGTGDRPANPNSGDLFFDTDLKLVLFWNGSTWIPLSYNTIISDGTNNAPDPNAYPEGTLWFNSAETEAALYILYEDPTPAQGNKWIQIAGGGIDIDEIVADIQGEFVRTNGDANVQTITGTGGLKTEGLLESEGGVKVSGGTEDTANIRKDVNGHIVLSNDDNANQITIRESDAAVGASIRTGIDSGFIRETPGQALGVNIETRFDGTKNVNITSFKVLQVQCQAVDYTGIDHVTFYHTGGVSGNPKELYYYVARGLGNLDCPGEVNYGFFSGLRSRLTNPSYNFYANGTAPNFFKGDTYIGGNTARNTFELWKSTLTEEQLEQFEAGTLVAPANVSTPGDGSFARAWYYDQQDAETQALLDSGELEYPEHFAAATFVDTFNLGVTTNTDLLNTGVILNRGIGFKGRVAGGDIVNGFTKREDGGVQLIGTIEANNDEYVGLSSFTRNPDGLDVSNFYGFRAAGVGGTTINESFGFAADANITGGAARSYGFYSDIATGSGNFYNFYANGSAPNYFKGLVESEGGVKVTGGSAATVDTGIYESASAGVKYLNLASNNSEGVQVGTFLNNPDNKIITLNGRTTVNHLCLSPSVKGDVGASLAVVPTLEKNTSITQYGGYVFADDATVFTGFNSGDLDVYTGANSTITRSSDIYDVAAGFYTTTAADTTHNNRYGFYAASTAPNFFKGDTYIGGNTTRNTFDLWKSTLTEEQLEQFEAGTLAVPANVSTPGDGSFARAWYYDQQDEETQLALDSGELEYPTHLAAATFTDTFTLGEKTKIDLIAASGVVKTSGLSFSKGSTTIGAINYNGFYYAAIDKAPRLIGSCESDTDDSIITLNIKPYAYNPATGNNVSLAFSKGLMILQPSVEAGTNADSVIDDVIGLEVQGVNTNVVADNGTVAAISLTQNAITTDGKTAYAIRSTGSAPNYFRGDLLFNNPDNPRVHIHANGCIESLQPSEVDGKFAGFRALSQTNQSSDVNKAYNVINNSSEETWSVSYRGQAQHRVPTVQATNANKALSVFNGTSATDASWSVAWNGDTVRSMDSGNYVKTDRRLLPSVTSIANASSLIQQLSPGQEGFIADELEAIVPNAVTGTQDATEPIGTLTDYDGTVLETEVAEPSAEELTYTEEVETDGVTTMVTRTKTWSATGTRDVYQGVDQTKLIPLLTKALQEALDRIEELESNTLQPLYSTVADLPDASAHHGKTAHVHSEGALYFAHGGNWVKLQNA